MKALITVIAIAILATTGAEMATMKSFISRAALRKQLTRWP
jgi:hypothetical protein